MNVSLDATPLTLSSGGLPRYVSELSRALAREFPEDHFSLISDQKFGMPDSAPANLTRGPGPGTVSQRRWWLWGIRKALAETRAQVFHGTNFEVPYLPGVPSVLTIHDLSPWRNKSWHDDAGRVRDRAPWLIRLKCAGRIVTVSEAVRREVISRFQVQPETVVAIPLAASPEFRPCTEGRFEGYAWMERPFFLFVGTLEPRKNIASLIDAWQNSRDETLADLVIVGRKRSDFAGIVPSQGMHLPGEIPDSRLPELYSRALAFVYPSHYEGFGLPVLEAMQCGCPVITSADPAITEVTEGNAIHTNSTAALAEAMKSVAADPQLRSTLRAAGLKRAADFSWARTARETRAVYAQLMGNAFPGRP